MTLDDVRVNIDRVDKQIKELFQERMELADQVAQVKAETGDNIFKPDREVAIISRLTEDVEPGIKREYIALIKRIMEISRKYQYGRTLEMRDCLDLKWDTEDTDPKQVAMLKTELYLCDMVSKDSVKTFDSFDKIGDSIESGLVDAGIGVLQDVSVGVSDEMHTMLVKKNLKINKCKIVEADNRRKKIVMFSKKLVVRPEDNRLKFMFVCNNKSGALASILSMISDYNVTLTEIHSKPDEAFSWNYEFYAEIEANLLQKEIQALVFQLKNETEFFKILGSYECRGDV